MILKKFHKGKNILPLTVVIPTLGEKSLRKTLQAIVDGDYMINEIIIVIPKKNIAPKYLKNFKNIKLLTTHFSAQVLQRIEGFKIAKNKFVLQLDSDCKISNQDIQKMIHVLKKLGNNNAIAPIYYDNVSKTCIHKYRNKASDLLSNIINFIICGSKLGIERMGTISKVGTNFGFDPQYMKYDLMESDWLPGGCVLMHKKNLIIKDFFPFKGKAYCEDLIHSYYLKQKGVKLWIYKKADLFTLKPRFPKDKDSIDGYLNSYNYYNKIQSKSVIRLRFRIWYFLNYLRRWIRFNV